MQALGGGRYDSGTPLDWDYYCVECEISLDEIADGVLQHPAVEYYGFLYRKERPHPCVNAGLCCEKPQFIFQCHVVEQQKGGAS